MDKDLFYAVIKKYKDSIFAIAFQYCKNPYDADDVVQEVFLKYYTVEKEFESEEHIRNWLIRVAVNTSKKLVISPWKKRHLSLEDYVETLTFEEPEESEVFYAVMELPEKYRIVVHLYYQEGYSTKEVAEILHIRESTVSTRLLRARKMLKEKLQEVWKDE